MLELDPKDEHFVPKLRAIVATSGNTKLTQVRVDENRLRRQKLDVIPKLIEEIKEAEKNYPMLVEHEAANVND